MISPFLKWAGSKTDEIDNFKSYIPQSFDTYVEPFVGGGSVFFYLSEKKCKKVINDAHEELIILYNQIKMGNAPKIVKMCEDTGNTDKAYYRIRDEYVPHNEIEMAFRFYYRSKLCFRGMTRYNSKGEFNIPYGKYKSVDWSTIADSKYKKCLEDVDIRLGSFDVVMKEFDSPNTFMFLDPPYDSEFKNYYLNFDKKHHEHLAEIFHNSKSMLMMIIAETDFIRSLYKDSILDYYSKTYRFRIRSNRVKDNQLNKRHLIIGKNIENKFASISLEKMELK